MPSGSGPEAMRLSLGSSMQPWQFGLVPSQGWISVLRVSIADVSSVLLYTYITLGFTSTRLYLKEKAL